MQVGMSQPATRKSDEVDAGNMSPKERESDSTRAMEMNDPVTRKPDTLDAGLISSKGGESEAAPDGGLRAWLVAAGGGTVFFCCLGFTNTFGTFEAYYLIHQLSDKTPEQVAWIGSLAAFLQFAVGLFAGPLFDRFGAKVSPLYITL